MSAARDSGLGAAKFIRGVVTVDGRDSVFPQYSPLALDILEGWALCPS